ncbi:MAG: J domain-containing protein [bacterium]
MSTPYEILEVEPSATDEEIKAVYIEKVKRYPPDRFPETFKEIRDAYEKIATLKHRIDYRLFSTDPPDLNRLLERLLSKGERKRLSPQCLVETALQGFQTPKQHG